MSNRPIIAGIRSHAAQAFLAGALLGLLASGCDSGPSSKDSGSNHASGQYAFWPPFPDEPRVQFIQSYGSSNDLSPRKSSGLEDLVFGKDSTTEAAIKKPYGVAMKDGKIYVCDMRSSSLTVLDIKKLQTRLLGVTGVNRLEHPVAVAVADDGEIFVADNGRGAILVFDASERYSRTIGFPKFKPAAVAVSADRVYACDVPSQLVQVFDRKEGKKIGTIGTVGDSDGQFRLPLGVTLDPHGNVVVVDMMRCRVQTFSPDGKFISGMGQLGDFVGSFARPKHIAIDKDGIKYVVDAAFQNVQMFDDKDKLLMAFGSMGAYPGAMDLPAGICVVEGDLEPFQTQLHPGFDAKRLVVVTNQFGRNKVSVYAIGKVKEGWTSQQLAAAALPVSSGVGVNEATVQFQKLGEMGEPNADPTAEQGAEPGEPAAEPTPPREESKPKR